MFFTAFRVFLLCFVAGGVYCGAVSQTTEVKNPLLWGCKEWETECLLGCCPLKNAVCCVDLIHCCPEGTFCIPFVGICLKTVNDNGQVSLASEKATDLRSSVSSCPPGWTECEPNKCCPYPEAVCCDDGEHCCPKNTKCDLNNMVCIPDRNGSSFQKPLRKMSTKSQYKSCPGGNRMCPGYMNCCLNNNGDWGCCPNPSVHELKYGGGQCCDSIFGFMCCPDEAPTCTLFGCTK